MQAHQSTAQHSTPTATAVGMNDDVERHTGTSQQQHQGCCWEASSPAWWPWRTTTAAAVVALAAAKQCPYRHPNRLECIDLTRQTTGEVVVWVVRVTRQTSWRVLSALYSVCTTTWCNGHCLHLILLPSFSFIWSVTRHLTVWPCLSSSVRCVT